MLQGIFVHLFLKSIAEDVVHGIEATKDRIGQVFMFYIRVHRRLSASYMVPACPA
jgi:hypothetical protein